MEKVQEPYVICATESDGRIVMLFGGFYASVESAREEVGRLNRMISRYDIDQPVYEVRQLSIR